MELNTVWGANDLIMAGLAYTVMGILVVFMILVIIMLVIKAMALFSKERTENTGNTGKGQSELKKAEAASAPAAAAAVKKEDDSEIIAVITAAIALMLGESATGFRVRSYRRVQDDEWNKAGRREVLDNRL